MVKIKFEFPDTGEGVTEGKFLEWEVEEGDEVEEDEVVGEAETDKAVVEIPAPADGTVEKLKVSPGDQVEVGEVIMELETGEKSVESDTEEEEKETSEQEDSGNTGHEIQHSSSDVLALPKVRKEAEERGIDLEDLEIDGRITEEDLEKFDRKINSTEESSEPEDKQKTSSTEKSSVEAQSEQVSTPENVEATPSVRKLAREKNVDISEIEGSGRGGKITREDVLDAGSTDETPSTQRDSENIDRTTERIELSPIQSRSADRVAESRFTAPHVTHVEKADVTELKKLREKVKDEFDAHITYLPFIIKACQNAMERHPKLNAEFKEEESAIIAKKFYDFNIAVDTEDGLMIPKVENVGRKSIEDLAVEIADKAERAKNSELDAEELKNGSFSITNLGVIGGEEFTPIINYPQTAILGIGKISETAEVVDGEVVPRTTVKLSLSYDHRAIDGAEAARFMNEIVENLEKPEKMLVKG